MIRHSFFAVLVSIHSTACLGADKPATEKDSKKVAEEKADRKAAADIARFCTSLRQNKEYVEQLALEAKMNDARGRNMAEGRVLYTEAMKEYNAAISYIRTTVGLRQDATRPECTKQLLCKAEEKANAFVEWYGARIK